MPCADAAAAATVYLVGAGPGDPGLVTVRALELIACADVVVYDYLANPALLRGAPAGAELVYVGKKGFEQHITQDEINECIIDAARRVGAAGVVVRLKGGDPFVFGRGAEEALALVRAGIPFEVVPGVTSAVAAGAYAGVPVTCRDISSSVTFVTGHEDPAKSQTAIDWRALACLASAGGTLCFYMGVRKLPEIVEHLLDAGAPPDIPCALVHWATMPLQRTLESPLSELAERAREQGFGAPSVILVGQAARLRGELAWYEGRPLFGRSVVVTRPRAQAAGFAARLAALGAEVIEFPVIEVAPPDSYGPLDAALEGLEGYDWVVFTSVNGVDAFFARLDGDARRLGGAKVAAIGPATAERLERYGIVADAVPDEYCGEALFEALCDAQQKAAHMRVLVARAQVARDALPDALRGAGAHVDVVAAYKTVAPAGACARELARRLSDGSIDAVTFTSPSTAHNLVRLLGKDAGLLSQTGLFSIGPVTSEALREAGYEPAREAREYTVGGLVEALVEGLGTSESFAGPAMRPRSRAGASPRVECAEDGPQVEGRDRSLPLHTTETCGRESSARTTGACGEEPSLRTPKRHIDDCSHGSLEGRGA